MTSCRAKDPANCRYHRTGMYSDGRKLSEEDEMDAVAAVQEILDTVRGRREEQKPAKKSTARSGKLRSQFSVEQRIEASQSTLEQSLMDVVVLGGGTEKSFKHYRNLVEELKEEKPGSAEAVEAEATFYKLFYMSSEGRASLAKTMARCVKVARIGGEQGAAARALWAKLESQMEASEAHRVHLFTSRGKDAAVVEKARKERLLDFHEQVVQEVHGKTAAKVWRAQKRLQGLNPAHEVAKFFDVLTATKNRKK